MASKKEWENYNFSYTFAMPHRASVEFFNKTLSIYNRIIFIFFFFFFVFNYLHGMCGVFIRISMLYAKMKLRETKHALNWNWLMIYGISVNIEVTSAQSSYSQSSQPAV